MVMEQTSRIRAQLVNDRIVTWNRDPLDGLVSTRASRDYYVDGLVDEPQLRQQVGKGGEVGFYGSMFLQDVTRLLPYRRGVEDGFTARLSPANERLDELFMTASPTQYGPAQNVEGAVRTFVEDCAQALMFGPVTYELAFYSRAASPEQFEAFRFEQILQGSVSTIKGRPVQFVPAGMSDRSTREGLHYVELDPATVFQFQLDPRTATVVAEAWEIFRAADRQQIVPTDMLTKHGGTSTGFVFSEHRSSVSALALSGTRELGWTGRDLFTDGMLDPFKALRHLRFLRFQLIVREATLSGLSALLVRAGERMGFEAKLTVEGLKNAVDLERAEAGLVSGTRSISDLLVLEI